MGYFIIVFIAFVNFIVYHYTGNILNIGAGGFCFGLLTALTIDKYYR